MLVLGVGMMSMICLPLSWFWSFYINLQGLKSKLLTFQVKLKIPRIQRGTHGIWNNQNFYGFLIGLTWRTYWQFRLLRLDIISYFIPYSTIVNFYRSNIWNIKKFWPFRLFKNKTKKVFSFYSEWGGSVRFVALQSSQISLSHGFELMAQSPWCLCYTPLVSHTFQNTILY